ncbi:MAG TPA: hypothetical protein VGC97_08255 [Pyrinomonadaceae bacterium]|jgi:hypothetical protein
MKLVAALKTGIERKSANISKTTPNRFSISPPIFFILLIKPDEIFSFCYFEMKKQEKLDAST